MKCALALSLLLGGVVATAQQIEVVDTSGGPVEAYEVMWHTADKGRSLWTRGGQRHLPRDADVIDLIVRADGFASRVERFEGESLAALHDGKAKIVMRRGEEVRLVLEASEATEVPDDFLPETYFEQFAWRARMGWQPVNRRNGRGAERFNMLNLRKVGDRQYALRLDRDSKPFFIAADQPGWLRFFEVGPFSRDDLVDQKLTIGVPHPPALGVRLEVGNLAESEIPFAEAVVEVDWPNPERDGSVYSATWNEKIEVGETRFFRDLGPGEYTISIRTTPKGGVAGVEGSEIHPGRFYAQQEVLASPGESTVATINWQPFNPDAVRGNCRARLKILRPNGSPASGAPARVSWFDGRYGLLEVFDGRVPEGGVIELEGISPEVATESPYGPYRVEVDGQTVGWFRLESTAATQEFEFVTTPGVGDQAPDITIADVGTGVPSKLSDYRGRVVLLELWATWCGPCQPAMAKLDKLAEKKREWADRVAILPVSVDKTPGLAADHVAERGWTALRHFWSAPVDDGQSGIERSFVVRGVPTAILIDAEGKIAWRGHPQAELRGGVSLEERIGDLLGDD